MKGDRLGEFEELLLLGIWALGDQTYGVPLQQHLERSTGRNIVMGAVYAALDRLEQKGFVQSVMGEATRQRGGKRKRLFSVTPLGKRTLREIGKVRQELWQIIEAGRTR